MPRMPFLHRLAWAVFLIENTIFLQYSMGCKTFFLLDRKLITLWWSKKHDAWQNALGPSKNCQDDQASSPQNCRGAGILATKTARLVRNHAQCIAQVAGHNPRKTAGGSGMMPGLLARSPIMELHKLWGCAMIPSPAINHMWRSHDFKRGMGGQCCPGWGRHV